MTHDYPDDADGEALRRVASDGNDMTRPMDIDFQIAAPDEFTANLVASEAAELGYATNITFDDEELDLDDRDRDFLWTCTCTINMVPDYQDLIRRQIQLNQIAQPLGAYSDGWGNFGNQEPK